MSKDHISEKLRKKLDKEGIQIKDENVRFTVTHLNAKGKVLGRDWYKGFVGLTDKRFILVADEVKFLNLKRGDQRLASVGFIEDNVACLEVVFIKEPSGKRLTLHIYSDKAHKLSKRLQKVAG